MKSTPALITAVIVAVCGPVHGLILYETEFDTPDAVHDWQVISGLWALDPEAGTYTGSGTERILSVYEGPLANGGQNSELTDYVITAELQKNAVAGGLAGRYMNAENYYLFRHHPDGELQIYAIASSGNTLLGTAAYPTADLPERYTLTFDMVGTTLAGTLLEGDTVLASVTVEDGAFPRGAAGLRIWAAEQAYHSFAIMQIQMARFPSPADGAVGVTTPLLQWTPGAGALFHDVYFGTNPELTEADLVMPRSPMTLYYHVAGLEPGATYYWRVDEIETDMVTVHTGDVWSFTAQPVTSWAPDPADGTERILPTPSLSWAAGQKAIEHHLYFGRNPNAVLECTPGADRGTFGLAETTYQVTEALDLDTAYYWRVDEIASDGSVEPGEVWTFTTIGPGPGGAIREWWFGNSATDVNSLVTDPRFPDDPDGRELVDAMEGPVNWANQYGSRLYGWLYPKASGDYTFWIASDDNSELHVSSDDNPSNKQLIASVTTWTASREWTKEATQVSQPITLEAGRVYYIEAIMNEGTGGDNIAVAWRGPGIPLSVISGDDVGPTSVYPARAFAPSPRDRAVDTLQNPILSWSAGEAATQHDVYFGDDADAVANADTSSPEYRGQQAGTTYNPGALEWGKTFYWRIDEKEGDGTVRKGKVWSFTTASFIVVEDFESYDDADNRIYQTWMDGVDNGTGSYVGYPVAGNGTFGETQIVYSGNQSMPLDYNNVNPPYYSETERTFETPQNWTVDEIDTLTLYVQGQASNDANQPLYVALEDSAGNVEVASHPDPAILTTTSWTEWNIPLSDLARVNIAAIKKMYIGVGNRDTPAPGGTGLIFIDAIRLTNSALPSPPDKIAPE